MCLSRALVYCLLITVFSNIRPLYSKPLVVGALDFPPYYIVKPNLEVKGLFPEMISLVLKEAKIDFLIESYLPEKLYSQIRSGKVDLFMGAKDSSAIKDYIISSDLPIISVELRVYANKDKPIPTTKEGLKNSTLIGIRGYQYGGLIKYLNDPQNGIDFIKVNSHTEAFKMLEKETANYLLEYKYPAEEYLQTNKIEGIEYKVLKKIPINFLLSKNFPEPERVLKLIVDTFNKMKKEGKLFIKP